MTIPRIEVTPGLLAYWVELTQEMVATLQGGQPAATSPLGSCPDLDLFFAKVGGR